MTTLMDIIFASFLGGVITLLTLNENMVLRETWTSYNSQVIVQQTLISTAQLLEGELRNMGSGIPNGVETITEAEDTCISFKMTLRPDPGLLPSAIKYYTGSHSELATVDNPNVRYLYRQQDGGNPQVIGMVTQFLVKYIDNNGAVMTTPITDPNSLINIKLIEITMEVQSPFAVILNPDQKFASALWKQTRLASQNLQR